jgi:hypothetical protein
MTAPFVPSISSTVCRSANDEEVCDDDEAIANTCSTNTPQLTGVEQGKYLRRRGTDSPVPYETEPRFEPAGEGTRVSWHQESGSLGDVLGKLADGMVAKLYARGVRSSLENATTLIEV